MRIRTPIIPVAQRAPEFECPAIVFSTLDWMIAPKATAMPMIMRMTAINFFTNVPPSSYKDRQIISITNE